MDENDKRKLKANHVQLVRNLNPEDVTDYLYQEKVLTAEDLEDIEAEPGRKRKVRLLLTRIQLRNKDALKKLIVALNESGYCQLADKLQGTDEVDEPEEAYDETEESKDPLHNLTVPVLTEKILEQADFVQAMQIDTKKVFSQKIMGPKIKAHSKSNQQSDNDRQQNRVEIHLHTSPPPNQAGYHQPTPYPPVPGHYHHAPPGHNYGGPAPNVYPSHPGQHPYYPTPQGPMRMQHMMGPPHRMTQAPFQQQQQQYRPRQPPPGANHNRERHQPNKNGSNDRPPTYDETMRDNQSSENKQTRGGDRKGRHKGDVQLDHELQQKLNITETKERVREGSSDSVSSRGGRGRSGRGRGDRGRGERGRCLSDRGRGGYRGRGADRGGNEEKAEATKTGPSVPSLLRVDVRASPTLGLGGAPRSSSISREDWRQEKTKSKQSGGEGPSFSEEIMLGMSHQFIEFQFASRYMSELLGPLHEGCDTEIDKKQKRIKLKSSSKEDALSAKKTFLLNLKKLQKDSRVLKADEDVERTMFDRAAKDLKLQFLLLNSSECSKNTIGCVNVKVCQHSIQCIEADAIIIAVKSVNMNMNQSGIGNILQSVDRDADKSLKSLGSQEAGNCIELLSDSSNTLFDRYIVIVVDTGDKGTVERGFTKALKSADRMGVSKVVCNLIGTDMQKFVSDSESADIIFRCLRDYSMTDEKHSIDTLYICETNQYKVKTLNERLKTYPRYIEYEPSNRPSVGRRVLSVCSSSRQDMNEFLDKVSDVLDPLKSPDVASLVHLYENLEN